MANWVSFYMQDGTDKVAYLLSGDSLVQTRGGGEKGRLLSMK